MILWVDDLRDPKKFLKSTENVFWAKDFWEAKNIIKTNFENIEEIHLDHDLGDINLTGYDVMCLIEMLLRFEKRPTILNTIYIHTSNPVGAERMMIAKDILENKHNVKMIRRHL